MADEQVPKVKPGEEYRLRNGNEVIVDKVEGNAVSGSVRPAAITSSGVKGKIETGLGVFEGNLDQFRGAEKIR